MIYTVVYCHPVESAMPNAQVNDDTSTVRRAVWDSSKHESFLQNLNNEDINHFINHMNSIESDFTKEKVELLTSQCSTLLYNASDSAGMIKHSNFAGSSNSGCKNRKCITRPWFYTECR